MSSDGNFLSIRYRHEPAIDFSLVIPVKDEEDNISVLCAEVSEVLSATTYSWECIWIDDGSTDSTPAKLEAAFKTHPHHRCIRVEKSCGQSVALGIGFSDSLGRVVAMMDGDGQNDPHDIPALMAELERTRADVVNGYRNKRQDSIVRKISSRLANGVRNRLTHETIRDVGCSLRVIRRECLTGLPVFKGMHRFLPSLIRMNGFNRITEVPVNHRPRRFNQPKYGISNRLWVGIYDLFAIRWMRARMTVSPVIRPRAAKVEPVQSR
jgi:dolichol-phosphate mannosyltransferase